MHSGVGSAPADVLVSAIKANDTYPNSAKGGLENFWRSVEGLTCTASQITWAVSQAAPLRRLRIDGDLHLSQQDGEQVHYTSGGFMADISVGGTLNWGSQQQFFFRNSEFNNVDYTGSGRSFVFVGVRGVPTYDQTEYVYRTEFDRGTFFGIMWEMAFVLLLFSLLLVPFMKKIRWNLSRVECYLLQEADKGEERNLIALALRSSYGNGSPQNIDFRRNLYWMATTFQPRLYVAFR